MGTPIKQWAVAKSGDAAEKKPSGKALANQITREDDTIRAELQAVPKTGDFDARIKTVRAILEKARALEGRARRLNDQIRSRPLQDAQEYASSTARMCAMTIDGLELDKRKASQPDRPKFSGF